MNPFAAYLPQDRRRALARGETLPDPTAGAALFADISGFTPLTEALTDALGPRRGAEALTLCLNQVYDGLIAEVERYGGSVLSFAGDAMICWFDAQEGQPSQRAVACAVALQAAMMGFATLSLPGEVSVALALKTAVASGPARRFVVGKADLQLIDALAGATIARTATAEHLASPGEVLLDAPTVEVLGLALPLSEWRIDSHTEERFAVLAQPSVSLAGDLCPPDAVLRSPALEEATLSPEHLRPWLLPAVYQREQAGQGAFLTEFRPAVALFLRFAGWDYDHPEVGVRLDAFIGAAQARLMHEGGTLLQLTIGDKGSYFHAAFGAPIAHEDDPRRAIKAALALRDLAAEFDDLEPIQIGLSQGTMRVGVYGGTTRHTYGVLGDEVNLAARLMQRAAPGEILLSEPFQQALTLHSSLQGATGFSLTPHLPLALKGKAEPVVVFTLTGSYQRRVMGLQEPTYTLPMVGREAELGLIARTMEATVRGQGHLVGITGEAGMGKSRLVAEVIRLARQSKLTGYGGACQSDGLNTLYLLWQPIFWAIFGLDPATPLRRQIRALRGKLEALVPHRVEALPLLGSVLGLPLPDNEFTRSLEPQFRKTAMEALLVDCVRAAAEEARADGGGLLLVLEDLHWLDVASHDLLEQVARAIPQLPVLVVLAYRPPEVERLQAPRVERLPRFSALRLTELNDREAEQVIRAKLAQLFPKRAAVPDSLVAQLTGRAQGNPFYLEELLHYLHDQGLEPQDEQQLATLELPSSLHSLILSRIDQLIDQQQLTLKVASIIGRMFRFAHLYGYYPILGEADAIKADLEVLRRLDLTPLEMPEPELAYLFKHIVTHEVAYESLGYATRAHLHEAYAQYLEAHTSVWEEHDLELLLYHYDRSSNLPKQREYLWRAGEAAAAQYANDQAIEHLSRALALTPETEPTARFDLLLARVKVYNRQGDRPAQWQGIEALRDLAGHLGEALRRVEVRVQEAIYAERIGDYAGCIRAAEEAALEGQATGALAVVAEAYHYWAWALLNQGDYETARHQAGMSLEVARSLTDGRAESQALHTLGVIADYQGDHVVARRYLEQSLHLARKLGDRPREGRALNSLGLVAMDQGEYAVALAYLEQRLLITREIGDQRAEGIVLGNLGGIAVQQGDYDRGRRYLEQSLPLAQAVDDRQGEGLANGNLGSIAVQQGEYSAARAYYDQSLQISRTIGDRESQAWALWGVGNAALGQGQLRDAAEAYQQSLGLRRELGVQALTMETLAGLVRVALAQGEVAQAQAQVEEILLHLAEGNLEGTEEPFWIYLTCYEALQATYDPRAGSLLRTAYTLLQERASTIHEEAGRRMFLENVPHHQRLLAAWSEHLP